MVFAGWNPSPLGWAMLDCSGGALGEIFNTDLGRIYTDFYELGLWDFVLADLWGG